MLHHLFGDFILCKKKKKSVFPHPPGFAILQDGRFSHRNFWTFYVLITSAMSYKTLRKDHTGRHSLCFNVSESLLWFHLTISETRISQNVSNSLACVDCYPYDTGTGFTLGNF